MYSIIALGFLASLSLLTAAHPFPAKLDRRVCHFDDANPLILARNANNVKRQSLELGSVAPADLTTPLDEVWKHTEETRPNDLGFANYGYDQIIAGEGKINYCVRWESSQSVTEAQRASIETAVQRSFKKWVDVLAGYDGWPYSTVDVQVVGWAVTSEGLLEGDTSGIEVYTTTDGQGAPECDPSCGRFFHQDGDYSGCAAGAERHYDQSLWLTDGFSGGAGGDWGQRVGSDYFLDNVDSEDLHIQLHEIGHTFGLDDFYDWTPTGVESFIMKAGASTTITTFDAWMARDWWTKAIKSRYPNLGSSESAALVESAAPVESVTPTSAIFSSIAASTSETAPSSSTEYSSTTVSATPSSVPATYTPPAVPTIPTLSSVVSAFPTGYYPGGNATVAPSGSVIYPASGTAVPTGGTAYPTDIYSILPVAESSSPGVAAPSYTHRPWGQGHRLGKSRFVQKHEWRD